MMNGTATEQDEARSNTALRTVLAPSAAVCGCSLARGNPQVHDHLLGIEDGGLAWWWATVLEAQAQVTMIGGEPLDPSDWAAFASYHNWRDPVAVTNVFTQLGELAAAAALAAAAERRQQAAAV